MIGKETMDILPTVRIKSANGSYIVINKSDFDPSKHELWVKPTKKPDVKDKAAGAAPEKKSDEK